METTAPTSSVSLHEAFCELHFAVGGFWKVDEIQKFLGELNTACLPLVKAHKPIHVLGDMHEFMPQNREAGDAIRDHLMTAKKFGLARVAILSPSALVKIQYRRLSQGVEVEFFDSKTEALQWLRKTS